MSRRITSNLSPAPKCNYASAGPLHRHGCCLCVRDFGICLLQTPGIGGGRNHLRHSRGHDCRCIILNRSIPNSHDRQVRIRSGLESTGVRRSNCGEDYYPRTCRNPSQRIAGSSFQRFLSQLGYENSIRTWLPLAPLVAGDRPKLFRWMVCNPAND